MTLPDKQNINSHHLRKLLLKCILSEADISRRRFAEWEKQIVYDDLDIESFELLAAVYPKLRENNIDSRLFLRIKGAHRRAWTENQLLLTDLNDLFSVLKTGGIDFLIADEAIRLIEIYSAPGTSPLQNFALLAPIDCRKMLVQKAIENGWKLEADENETTDFIKDNLFRIGVQWLNETEFDCRLKRAETISFKDFRQPILCREDQVLNLCAREFLLFGEEDTRWQLIVSELFKAGKVNSDKLFALAEDYFLVNELARMLEILVRDFAVPIPAELTNKLNRNLRNERYFSVKRKILNFRQSYQIYSEYQSTRGFFGFLANRWQTASAKDMLKYAFQAGIRLFQAR